MILRLWIKKIFGAFLIIAITASGLLWVLGQERKITFTVPPAPLQTNTDTASYSVARAIPPEQNLTHRFSEILALELIEKNQDGPLETAHGLSIAINPAETLTKIAKNLKQIPQQPFKGVTFEEIRVSHTDSSQERRAYFENLAIMLNRALAPADEQQIFLEALVSAVAQNPTALDPFIQRRREAISETRNLPVPVSLAGLHKKQINLLTKSKIILEGIAAGQEDPFRATLALNIYPALVEEAQSLQKEFKAAIEREYLSMNFWEHLFGHRTAYALIPGLPLGVPVIEMWVWPVPENVMRLITEVLKDRLLAWLENLVMEHVKGQAGPDCPFPYFPPGVQGAQGARARCPRFVMNWEQVLFHAQSESSARLAREINQSNIPEMNRQVLLAFADPPAGAYGTTFEALTQHTQRCEDTGDPVAYMLCLANFKNSFEYQFILALQRREELGTKYVEGRKAAGIAADGFTDRRKCARFEEALDARAQPRCIEWITTEPGIITRDLAGITATVDWHRIVNAFDLQSLLAALMSMFIKQLTAAGTEGLLGLITQPGEPEPPAIPHEQPPIPRIPVGIETPLPVPVKIEAPLPVPVEIETPLPVPVRIQEQEQPQQ
jgi:hypothetical protein